MELKYMTKNEIEELIRTEVKTLKRFLKKVNKETKYETHAFAKISLIDDEEKEIRTKSLKFGDPDLLKTIVLRDELLTLDITCLLNTILDEEENEDEI